MCPVPSHSISFCCLLSLIFFDRRISYTYTNVLERRFSHSTRTIALPLLLPVVRTSNHVLHFSVSNYKTFLNKVCLCEEINKTSLIFLLKLQCRILKHLFTKNISLNTSLMPLFIDIIQNSVLCKTIILTLRSLLKYGMSPPNFYGDYKF